MKDSPPNLQENIFFCSNILFFNQRSIPEGLRPNPNRNIALANRYIACNVALFARNVTC